MNTSSERDPSLSAEPFNQLIDNACQKDNYGGSIDEVHGPEVEIVRS